MNDKGFLKLSRKFFSHRMWEAARTFSECEAWLDLIQSARFEATDKTECIGGREITYKRGQYPASLRFLSKRWRWGEQKVRSFLVKLKKEGMIDYDNSQGMNIITLCNYNEYNGNNTQKNTFDNTPNELIIKELQDLKTRLATLQLTQYQHSSNTNSKKEEEREEYNIPPIIPHEFLDLKKQMLEDWQWKEHIARNSKIDIKVMLSILPVQIDNFISYAISVGKKNKLKEKTEAQRYFFFWWSDRGKKEYKMQSYWNDDSNTEDTFAKMKKWIKDNAPNLMDIKQQLTRANLTEMLEMTKNNKTKIIEVLSAMNNDSYIIRNSASVFDSWKDKYAKIYGK